MVIPTNEEKQNTPCQLSFPGFPEPVETEAYDFVYGASCCAEGLVFIEKADALELTATSEALSSSSTWGEFKSHYTPKRFQEVLESMGFEGPTYEEYRNELADEDPSITQEKARQLYHDLDLLERMPLDDEPFDLDAIPAVSDGDWPDWPEQLMLSRIPREILNEYGLRQDSMLNGPFAVLDSDREDEIVAVFRELGYRCRRDDEMVVACSGR